VLTNLGAARGTAAKVASYGTPSGSSNAGTSGMSQKERNTVLGIQLAPEKSKR